MERVAATTAAAAAPDEMRAKYVKSSKSENNLSVVRRRTSPLCHTVHDVPMIYDGCTPIYHSPEAINEKQSS